MLNDSTPRHEQISNWLRAKIESGQYTVDEKLPSENDIREKFGVSRVTVRKALQTLESEGLIYKSQGLGSFVKDKRSHQSFVRLTDFVEDMKRAGMEAKSEVIRMEAVTVPEQILPRLKTEQGQKVLRIDRLRKGNDKPVAFDITWLPMFYGQLLESYDLRVKTIYGILEEEYQIPVEKGYYRIEADNADSYLGRHLEIKEGTALLLFDRLSLTVGDKPVYYQKRFYRTDRIVYELTLERDKESHIRPVDMPLREFVPVFQNSD